MKKCILFLQFLVVITGLYSQNYQIGFVGSGSSSTVDSVQVLNLTQGTEITIEGTDILNLVGQVGIPQLLRGNGREVTISPNPVSSSAIVEFETAAAGLAQITICDITGKVLVRNQTILPVGRHSFAARSFNSGVYSLQVDAGGEMLSGKFASIGTGHGPCEINYLSSTPHPFPNDGFKSNRSIIQMQYNFGDLLMLTCFSGYYTTLIPLIPTQSATINADFADCTDPDGNHYTTVTIGQQVWMAENLRTTRYRNGNIIPNVTGNAQWSTLTTGAWSNYNHDTLLTATYGRLYNGFTISDSRNVAPVGWHVPSDAEWTALTDFVGGDLSAGGYLKETGLQHWQTPNEGANNLYAFTALPAGTRESTGSFANLHYSGYWWTSTLNTNSNLWYRGAYHSIIAVMRYDQPREYGFSIRCVKD